MSDQGTVSKTGGVPYTWANSNFAWNSPEATLKSWADFSRNNNFRVSASESVKVGSNLSHLEALKNGEADSSFSIASDVDVYVESQRRSADAVISDLLISTDSFTHDDFKSRMLTSAPVGYEPFRMFMEGDYHYQKAIFKVIMRSNGHDIGRLKELKITIDVPDIYDSGVCSMPPERVTIPFKRKFNAPPDVSVTLRGGLVISQPKLIDTQKDSFTVELIDANGARASGEISWTARGY
ncbi:hypothetical protein LJC19_04640 [Oxalobacter sp. OttesenSCG-928-P03]|nr:hypothetical protein [Oxalobacter sp. OttesenSCG-928-P03]